MSTYNDTELPQASPPRETIEDKLKRILHFYWETIGPSSPEPPDDETAIEEIQAIITTETAKARIDELENFEWNDPHIYVHTRLAALQKEHHD